MKTFKEYLKEYERTTNVVPAHIAEDDIDQNKYDKTELGSVHGHRVTHYHNKKNGMHHTFVVNDNNETVGHIGHKKPTVSGRLAISDVTKKKEAPKGLMTDVLQKLTAHGHTLESDSSNTESATKMLHNLSDHPNVKTHIENGKGEKIHHTGSIKTPENQEKYSIKSDNKNFLAPGNTNHEHILVFSKQK